MNNNNDLNIQLVHACNKGNVNEVEKLLNDGRI